VPGVVWRITSLILATSLTFSRLTLSVSFSSCTLSTCVFSSGFFDRRTVSVACVEDEPTVAVTRATPTAWVAAPKVAEVPPAGTVMVFGTLATLGLSLARATSSPLPGAGPLRVTVPVLELPGATALGSKASDWTTITPGCGLGVGEGDGPGEGVGVGVGVGGGVPELGPHAYHQSANVAA
jgi:hypothetical protein